MCRVFQLLGYAARGHLDHLKLCFGPVEYQTLSKMSPRLRSKTEDSSRRQKTNERRVTASVLDAMRASGAPRNGVVGRDTPIAPCMK